MTRDFLNGVRATLLELPDQAATPAVPAAGLNRVYSRETQGRSVLEFMDDLGVATKITRGDSWMVVQNNTATAMTKGQIVRMVSLAADGTPLVGLASNAAANTMPVLGILMEDLPASGFSRAMTRGVLTGISTSAFAAGDTLYPGATAGSITNVRPVAQGFVQSIGEVGVVGASGSIQVRISGFYAPAGPGRALVTADQTNANATANTMQNITGMAFPVSANLRYYFYAVLDYTAAATTTGARFGMIGPTVTRVSFVSRVSNVQTGTGIEVHNGGLPGGVPSPNTANAPANIGIMEGIIQFSASGTVQAQFASEVGSSAIVVKAGSFVEWYAI